MTIKRFRKNPVLIIALALVLAVGAQCAVRLLPPAAARVDITQGAILSPSAQTRALLSTLTEDVTLTLLATPGGQDPWVDALLARYAAGSPRVTYRREAPGSYAENTVLIHSARRDTSLLASDLYQVAYAQDTYALETLFSADAHIAAAIRFVVADKLPTVYLLTGHDEAAPTRTLAKWLARLSLQTETLPLAQAAAVPADAALVLINAPQADLSAMEASALLAYLRAGGSVLLLTDCTVGPLPNVSVVASRYGMRFEAGLVLDRSASRYITDYAQYILPVIAQTPANDAALARAMQVSAPLAHAITFSPNLRTSLDVAVLLHTSASGYRKPDVNAITTLDYQAGDPSGQQIVAALATEPLEAGTTRFAWIACASFPREDLDDVTGGANGAYLGDLLRTLVPDAAAPVTAPITVPDGAVSVTQTALGALRIAFGTVPALLLVAALLSWRRWRTQ